MEYEWDPVKARMNQRKHRIDFADAVTVFTDEQALTMPDEEHTTEERYITIGLDALGRILVVWHGRPHAVRKHSIQVTNENRI